MSLRPPLDAPFRFDEILLDAAKEIAKNMAKTLERIEQVVAEG